MILDFLRRNPGATARQISNAVNYGFETPKQNISVIRRYLRQLRDQGLVRMEAGDPKNTTDHPPRYYATARPDYDQPVG